ncbi:hypothetical protein ACLOJK_009679 [Asimina triloba]
MEVNAEFNSENSRLGFGNGKKRVWREMRCNAIEVGNELKWGMNEENHILISEGERCESNCSGEWEWKTDTEMRRIRFWRLQTYRIEEARDPKR